MLLSEVALLAAEETIDVACRREVDGVRVVANVDFAESVVVEASVVEAACLCCREADVEVGSIVTYSVTVVSAAAYAAKEMSVRSEIDLILNSERAQPALILF